MSNGILQGAHDLVFNDATLLDLSTHIGTLHMNLTTHNTVPGQRGSGEVSLDHLASVILNTRRLLKASMPDAFRDSSARYPPPRCHPGTRQDFIDEITSWALGKSSHSKHILWMHGPAGVGKSAVAQSCADLLAEKNELGAALFFSRSNERSDSNSLFTSIAYQLAIKSSLYDDILDHKIRKDPTLVTKSIMEQFQELLVKPLQHPRTDAADIGEWVIIVDGLDECGGIEAQHDVVEIIAASVREQTLPFRWVFFSRPESHIIAAFTMDNMDSLTRNLELPVSRDIDNEITLYLTDELRKIQRRRRLPDSWPSDKEIGTLVNLAAGLFIYASIVIRFIGERDSSGPMDQLCVVLSLATQDKSRVDSEHPLTELDKFYTLIMRRVPSKVLPIIQRILLLTSYSSTPEVRSQLRGSKSGRAFTSILGLSDIEFRDTCEFLHSVLELDWSLEIRFYHESFIEFLEDPNRSKEFCIYSCLSDLRLELFKHLNNMHSLGVGGMVILTCRSCYADRHSRSRR